MNIRTQMTLVCAALLFAAFPAGAEETPEQELLPRVPLVEVLDAVADNSGRTFVVDHRAMPTIVVGQPDLAAIDYPQLLTLLRNNGLAAVHSAGLTSIVPVQTVRQHPLPVLREPDPEVSDDEWVTWQVAVASGRASQYVPILRPMLPQEGHLAADPASNTITIIDRYANARRVVDLIEAMDEATPPDGMETDRE